MKTRALRVPDAYELTAAIHGDDRGSFREWFRADQLLDETGHQLTVAQANCSVSARGVLRGVHYADVPPGQAKYVTCLSGQVLDVVVDLRVGSPAFGEHDTVLLDADSGRAAFLAEGLGHAFIALTPNAVVAYLVSSTYDPEREHGVHPLDPALALPWPHDIPPLLSDKDGRSPTLEAAQDAGALPQYGRPR